MAVAWLEGAFQLVRTCHREHITGKPHAAAEAGLVLLVAAGQCEQKLLAVSRDLY